MPQVAPPVHMQTAQIARILAANVKALFNPERCVWAPANGAINSEICRRTRAGKSTTSPV
jgi:hypothetical protein